MPEETHDDEFRNLLAACIEADDPDEWLRDSDPQVAARVKRHLASCATCQAIRREVLLARGRRKPDDGA